jgi:DNA-binding NtrC family response regulator
LVARHLRISYEKILIAISANSSDFTDSMKPRILVVDDEPAVLLFTSTVLGRANFDVATAASAEEAVQRMGQEAFDLVVTDFRMRGESGEAVVLAARGQQPKNPVIIMTGWIHELPEWLRSGPAAVRIITKPFSVADLRKVVNETLGSAPVATG